MGWNITDAYVREKFSDFCSINQLLQHKLRAAFTNPLKCATSLAQAMDVSDGEERMMDQYMDIKAEHPDSVLFFRMGDFYEQFHDDAVVASEVLGLALTAGTRRLQNQFQWQDFLGMRLKITSELCCKPVTKYVLLNKKKNSEKVLNYWKEWLQGSTPRFPLRGKSDWHG